MAASFWQKHYDILNGVITVNILVPLSFIIVFASLLVISGVALSRLLRLSTDYIKRQVNM